MALEYITSEKGKRLLFDEGHFFYTDRKVDSKIYWKCESYHKVKCAARMITLDDSVIKRSGTHNHLGDAAHVEKMQVMTTMRDAARRTRDAPHYIISNVVSGVSQAAASRLGKVSSMKRTIRKIRTRDEVAPALPIRRSDIVFPQEYKITKNGEDFLMFDSGLDEDRILMFCTRRNLQLLAQADHWYADGTFKTVPHLFCQLYTLHGLKSNVAIPLIYALLPDKSRVTYVRLLQKIKELLPGVTPASIMTDFETGMISAITEEFPQSRHRGCFFHFSQCINRKIQSEGLKQRYETDADFALKMRLLAAIAFVPTADVVRAFEMLCDENILPPEAQPVMDYFEDTWIGRPHRRRRRPPLFSHDMWNCVEGVRLGLPKTNNAIEGWHRGFEQQISSEHPNIWKFVEAIQREQSLHELQVEQYVAGIEHTPARKKYRDCAERILRIVEEYNIVNLNEFLRGIAHNLGF